MSRIVALLFFIVIGMVTLGCQSHGSRSAVQGTHSDVLNVAATPTPAPTPAPAPIAPQPVYDAQPVSYASAAPASATPAVAASRTYTVKKGDTLFSIAKANYGTGREWQKIVAANPGLDPQKLKVGQTITIP